MPKDQEALETEQWLEDAVDSYGEMLKMNGYDDCILGVCVRFGQDPILLYDHSKLIERMVKEGMTHEEAEEFHEFNQLGAWLGDLTPAFLVFPR